MLQIEKLTVGMGAANCYIIYNDAQALIIDPGAEAESILQTIDALNVTPVAILLTHTHYDHIGAVQQVREHFTIPVYVSAEEQDWLEDPSKNLSQFSGAEVMVKPAEELFRPEELLTLADFQLQVVQTPGHSPGGVSFVFEQDEFVVTGDALFAGSVGRTDLPGSHAAALFQGIREKLFILPDGYTVYPGHGSASTIGEEKRTNPFFQ